MEESSPSKTPAQIQMERERELNAARLKRKRERKKRAKLLEGGAAIHAAVLQALQRHPPARQPASASANAHQPQPDDGTNDGGEAEQTAAQDQPTLAPAPGALPTGTSTDTPLVGGTPDLEPPQQRPSDDGEQRAPPPTPLGRDRILRRKAPVTYFPEEAPAEQACCDEHISGATLYHCAGCHDRWHLQCHPTFRAMNFGLGKRRLLDDYLGEAVWTPKRFLCPACLTHTEEDGCRATAAQKTAFLTGIDNLSACRWGERAKSILSEDLIPGKYLLTDTILDSYDRY